MGQLKLMLLDVVVNSGISEPELVPYDYLGFYKKKTTAKGLINRCEYYLEFDGENYSNLMVDVSYQHIFNGVVYTQTRTTVNWIDIDDQIGYTKVFVKDFTDWEKVNFGRDKRNNLLSTAKIYALGQIGVVNGYDLLSTCAVECDAYVDGPFQPLVDKINSLVGQKPYLNQQIADGINAILTDL